MAPDPPGRPALVGARPWSARPSSWPARGVSAGRLANDRPAAWVPAALAVLAFGGQLPFLLAVARLPDMGDLTVFTVGIVSSSRAELIAALLGATLFAVLALLAAAAALGEAATLRLLDAGAGGSTARRGVLIDGLAIFSVRLVVALPVVGLLFAAALATGRGLVDDAMAPAQLGPLWLRAMPRLGPWLATAAAALVVATALGALAGRYVTSTPGRPAPSRALAEAAAALARRPLPLIGTAVVALVSLAAYLLLSYLLLRVLWAPIGAALEAGRPLAAGTPLLLVGFVAIWLCCLLAGGVLHAWTAAWWALEADESRPP